MPCKARWEGEGRWFGAPIIRIALCFFCSLRACVRHIGISKERGGQACKNAPSLPRMSASSLLRLSSLSLYLCRYSGHAPQTERESACVCVYVGLSALCVGNGQSSLSLTHTHTHTRARALNVHECRNMRTLTAPPSCVQRGSAPSLCSTADIWCALCSQRSPHPPLSSARDATAL